ncbi:MAG: type II toxin-antitoxin system RelB/DinJ family antitoxin [Burkholderiaceae bacterium]|jgi:DNA-damage-inducible protein J|nr:type II toxin-antitoxin system RelB/DinJ family antitoxin [Burkholderiaceae bacterium]
MTVTADTFVRVRIDSDTKERASAALRAMGLSVSDALRIVLRRVANDQAFPLELKAPNAASREAMAEIKRGGLERVTLAEIQAVLDADD